MEIVTQEVTAWLRAEEVAGVTLPAPVANEAANLARIEAELATLPSSAEIPTAAQLVANDGMGLAEAATEVERITAEAMRARETYRTAAKARDLARARLNRAAAEHREAIIVEHLRPVMAELVTEARPLAATLAPFHPRFDDGTIDRKATPVQIKAWRASLEMEGRFGAGIAAWRASHKATLRMGGLASPAQVRRFDPRWLEPASYLFWSAPEYVANPALNGTLFDRYGRPVAIRPTLLGVASEPEEAGFRLPTVRELHELYVALERSRVAEARRGGRGMAV
jgi:hypothetical protein